MSKQQNVKSSDKHGQQSEDEDDDENSSYLGSENSNQLSDAARNVSIYGFSIIQPDDYLQLGKRQIDDGASDGGQNQEEGEVEDDEGK